MALVFTTYFIFGFFYASVAKSTGEFTNKQRKAGWIGFWLLTGGLVLAALMIALNKATVLYTFYAPLQASPFFYIALALIIIGTYFGAFAVISRYRLWKKNTLARKRHYLPIWQ